MHKSVSYMSEVLATWVLEHLPTFVIFVVAIVVLIIFVVWWCSKTYYKIKKIEELPCASNSQRIDLGRELQSQTNTAIAKIETSIEYLQKCVEALSQNMQKNRIVLDPFTQSHSPLSITERGMEMLKSTGIDEMFECNWERIRNDIEQNVKSNTAYDVQQYCLEQAVVFPEKFLSDDELNKVKNISYNSGVPLASYMKVVAILSRDRYFAEHCIDPNIIE